MRGRQPSAAFDARHGAFYVSDYPRCAEPPEKLAAELASLRVMNDTLRAQVNVYRNQAEHNRSALDEAMCKIGRLELRRQELTIRADQLEAANRSLQEQIATGYPTWPTIAALLGEWRTIVDIVTLTGIAEHNVRTSLQRHVPDVDSELVPGQVLIKRWRLKDRS